MYQYRSPPAIDTDPFDSYSNSYNSSRSSTLISSPSSPFASSTLSRMASPGGANSGVAQRSSTWQDKLEEHCQNRRIPLPSYNVLSDRRGKRTAWSCTVSVGGQNIPARYWYDGQYVNTAKEDAAEAALKKLVGNGSTAQGPSNGLSQQGRVLGWGR
ncbi:hypothetical protein ABVK25_009209 [Lepraria finkii]|uniref:Uncharacterized protein n=1 Tax=Lepraria finkii TaxID=1340010 RepID=A0ABR4AY06_9LECA